MKPLSGNVFCGIVFSVIGAMRSSPGHQQCTRYYALLATTTPAQPADTSVFFCSGATRKTVSLPNFFPARSNATASWVRSFLRHPQLLELPYNKLRSRTYLSVPQSQRQSHLRSPFLFFSHRFRTVQRPKRWPDKSRLESPIGVANPEKWRLFTHP